MAPVRYQEVRSMSLRLLVADDHPLLRQGLRVSLTDQGFDVIAEASDGRSAVDLALQHRPDVVVMDIGMPDLDGLEATRRILSARPAARVLVLTGHDDEQMRDAARAAGARAFVVKSASTQELTDTVRALARGESPLARDAEPTGRRVAPLARMQVTTRLHDPVLTRRETEVLQMFANGRSTVEVARGLTISQKTVKNHLTSIYQKLNVRDRTEAVLLAVRMGIIRLERRTRPRA
jgi:two-component system, NarL family, response regulator DegU